MNKFSDFVQNALAPNGLAEEHIEQLVRDQLCLNQIKQLLATGVSLPKKRDRCRLSAGLRQIICKRDSVSSGRFRKDIKISDEEVQKYYETHKAELKTEEKRKVDFVSLALN